MNYRLLVLLVAHELSSTSIISVHCYMNYRLLVLLVCIVT